MKDEIKEILDNTLEYLEGIDETRNTKILTTNETKILLDYITNLQEKVNQYENPDDLTIFYMWLDAKAKDKMKQLQEENERLRFKKWQIKTLKEEWLEINENTTLVFENNSLIEFMNKLENILQGEDK